jgi:hydroxyethylthiazole kinase-like uncharacterized protein yjeF
MNENMDCRGTLLWGRDTATAVDQISSGDFLIPSLALMEQAGRSVASILLDRCALIPEKKPKALILSGPGNNGGDALVTARYLSEAGVDCYIVAVFPTPTTQRSPSCALQAKILERLGHAVHTYGQGSLRQWRDQVAESHIWIVDGILGLGGRSDIPRSSMFGKALEEASMLPEKTVLSVDIPSGLNADDGTQRQVWLKADITVTFGEKKPAHILSPARDSCGEIVVKDIGFPLKAVSAALRKHPPQWLIPDAKSLIAQNPWSQLGPSAHKYDRGHVLVLGGSVGKTGAPLLSGMSALRTGAGWVTVAMPPSAMASLRGEVPRELVFETLFMDESDQIDANKLQIFLAKNKVRAIVIGPGTMKSPLTAASLAVIRDFCLLGGFAVFDAGACHDLKTHLDHCEGPKPSASQWIMTPHPGEWTKIGLDDASPPLNPEGHAKISILAVDLSIAMLYKGATPVLFTGISKRPALVSTEGSKILARAGSGDLLAGIIGAHTAMGLTTDWAAMRSQILMARAARHAADRLGPDAVLAHDILNELGRVGSIISQE